MIFQSQPPPHTADFGKCSRSQLFYDYRIFPYSAQPNTTVRTAAKALCQYVIATIVVVFQTSVLNTAIGQLKSSLTGNRWPIRTSYTCDFMAS